MTFIFTLLSEIPMNQQKNESNHQFHFFHAFLYTCNQKFGVAAAELPSNVLILL